MSEPLFKAADLAARADIWVKLIPAPLTDGKTVTGYSGVIITATCSDDGIQKTSVGIVQPDGSVIGALMDDGQFDLFCLELAPFVERARDRIHAWEGATRQ